MKYFSLLFFILNCHASEVLVNTLNQGSCWYQEKDGLKISSFNDREAITTSIDDIESSLFALLPVEIKDVNRELQALHLHCGTMGASFVARVKSESGSLCLWAMLDKGKLKIRSLGGTADVLKGETKLCDGYKQGELLVVLKNHEYLDQIRSEKWSSVVKEVIPVAFNIYKIKLTGEYLLREEEVAKMFQDSLSVQVEFNHYQHGIGEYVQLK